MAENNSSSFIAALFDLDGVLIDTEGAYTRFWDIMSAKYDKPSTFALDIKGTTLSKILDSHFPKEDHEDIEKAVHQYEVDMPFEFFDGVEAFLHALKGKDIPMAIVTSSDDNKIRSLKEKLPALTDLMDVIVDGTMVSRSKPDPEGYLIAARMLNCPPERCIVFEDSLQGLESGRRAGCKVVGLITTNPKEKVEPLCDVAVYSFSEITPEQLGF